MRGSILPSQHRKRTRIADTTIPHAHTLTTLLVPHELEPPLRHPPLLPSPQLLAPILPCRPLPRAKHLQRSHHNPNRMPSTDRIPRLAQIRQERLMRAGLDGAHAESIDVGDGGVDGGFGAGFGLGFGGEVVACCCCCRGYCCCRGDLRGGGGRGGGGGGGEGGFARGGEKGARERERHRRSSGRRLRGRDVVRVAEAGAPVAEIRGHDEDGGRVR